MNFEKIHEISKTIKSIRKEERLPVYYRKKEPPLSNKELLETAIRIVEQKYTRLSRPYYHISDKKFKIIKEMGNENRPALAFFAIDPKMCLNFTKYRSISKSSILYLYRCYLDNEVNLFNFFQKTSREKIKDCSEFQKWMKEIKNNQRFINHQLWWRLWENPEIIKFIQKLNYYDGLVLDYFDTILKTSAKKTYGIALFQGNKMTIEDYAICDENFDINNINWISKNRELLEL